MSSLTNSIMDSRLLTNIFQFVPSSSLAQVNRRFRDITYTKLYPLLIKNCADYLIHHENTFSPQLFGQIFTCKNAIYPSIASNILHESHVAIRAFASENGNRIEKIESLDPIPYLKHTSEEDQTLIEFLKVLSQVRDFPPIETFSGDAKKIRLWMHANKDSLRSIKHLNLSDKKIKTIPKEIELFEHLIILNISNNKIKCIPPEIGRLSKLMSINMSNNETSSLPEEFSHLKKLMIVSMHNNRFTAFPEVLLKLPGLKQLNLAFNGIVTIPIKEHDLPQLEQLDVSFNLIAELPENLHLRPRLKIDLRGNVDLSGNHFSKGPLYHLI